MSRVAGRAQREWWYVCAVASANAYKSLEEVEARFPSATVRLWDAEDTQAYAISWGDKAIVAFRGTQFAENFSMVDLIRNLRIDKRRVKTFRGRVHSGYFFGYTAVAMRLTGFLAHCKRNGTKVTLTGHSLGGATASIAAAEHPYLQCVTFGQPRAGDREFASNISHIDRLVYASDMATSWPPATFRNYHGGKRWQIHRDGTIATGQHWRDLIPIGWPPHRGTDDHDIDNYVNALSL